MGLSLCVGYLSEIRKEAISSLPSFIQRSATLTDMALRSKIFNGDYSRATKQFEATSKCLVVRGHNAHIEPFALPNGAEFSCQMFGYSGLHHLRQLAAYVALDKELYEPTRKLPSEKNLVVAEYDSLIGNGDVSELSYQHLTLHGDGEGVYVPQDFQRVVEPPAQYFSTVGGGIGSSIRLLEECKSLAAVLELPLDLDAESPEVWSATDQPGTGSTKWQRFGVESFSCIRLIRACERSIATGAAVVFC